MESPPLLGELLKSLASGVERREVAGALPAANLSFKGNCIGSSVERTSAIAISFAPSHAPADAMLPGESLDAHEEGKRLRSPPGVGNAARARDG
jgi:hypothetical protein